MPQITAVIYLPIFPKPRELSPVLSTAVQWVHLVRCFPAEHTHLLQLAVYHSLVPRTPPPSHITPCRPMQQPHTPRL